MNVLYNINWWKFFGWWFVIGSTVEFLRCFQDYNSGKLETSLLAIGIMSSVMVFIGFLLIRRGMREKKV